ncbi:MAG: hypothetical protein F6J94_01885 [Moorea sp. SIO1F2]|nr:hypothetical protein [Moorena sp. SIO3I7]NEO08197.1 hypothetical protein [Moorena sp. SIO3I8]NEO13977.1 hypothetical protein [Moorena sp. SIO3E8]NEO21055.1 hypothetical protein [Moorena sp. SIO4A5]NEO62231.1 hypothetical protein [Moorena sp. SIO4G2]NEP22169.1 hypothetical protein [Moorena sp. SIO3I6]NEQ00402.1 hypothetical protein [Moorena sp. SIO3F7]NEQ60903.1 hypothetical protein [Moorena sp. SIO4A1]NET80769.1 hypothetical protein [Moorena sp. SIO1F2]
MTPGLITLGLITGV